MAWAPTHGLAIRISSSMNAQQHVTSLEKLVECLSRCEQAQQLADQMPWLQQPAIASWLAALQVTSCRAQLVVYWLRPQIADAAQRCCVAQLMWLGRASHWAKEGREGRGGGGGC